MNQQTFKRSFSNNRITVDFVKVPPNKCRLYRCCYLVHIIALCTISSTVGVDSFSSSSSTVNLYSGGVKGRRGNGNEQFSPVSTIVPLGRRRRYSSGVHFSLGATDGNKEDSIEEVRLELNENSLHHKVGSSSDETVSKNITMSARGGAVIENEIETVGLWPCMDVLDKKLLKLAIPSIANFAISPLVGAVDLLWVGRMGNALALAGMSAANQVFNSAFWLFSFLPTITAPLVSKAHARGDTEEVQDLICQAIVLGSVISIVMSVSLMKFPDLFLGTVLRKDAPALEFARPYLRVRAFSFFPAMVTTVGFSAFRGILEPTTPLRISLAANVANAILDPILIFRTGLGVAGAALATATAEIISFFAYTYAMLKRNILSLGKLLSLPKWDMMKPLLLGGLAVQLRNVALNVSFLSVARATQGLDDTGIAAAAHSIAIQVFQVGGIFLLGLATVAAAIVPNEMEKHGKKAAKSVSNRLMAWGCILGCILGAIQIGVLPLIKAFSPLEEVQEAAKIPSIIASVLQIINGMVFIGEGIMAGTQSFLTLSLSTVVATVGMLNALKILTARYGLTGVWLSFGVWNFLRLAGVIVHQRFIGPISTRTLNREQEMGIENDM